MLESMGFQWALSDATHAITGGRMGPPFDKLKRHYSYGAGNGVHSTGFLPDVFNPIPCRRGQSLLSIIRFHQRLLLQARHL